ncbi:MAG TPA: DUF2497 domain-containing protein [Alphaproteobacteria bacterium]|nr:DUF2497 domain-containing protein [Alphaproteobacteria bacterium]
MEEILASIRRIISEDGEPAKGQAAPAPQRQADPDVLELTQEAMEELPPQREPERKAPPEKPRAARPDPAPERMAHRPQPAPPPSRQESDLEMVDKNDDGLVSSHTQSAVNQAFSMLSRSNTNDMPIAQGDGRTLEDIVAQMLRPMLKDWLEDNLPAMVERIVREEVERASRTTGRRR